MTLLHFAGITMGISKKILSGNILNSRNFFLNAYLPYTRIANILYVGRRLCSFPLLAFMEKGKAKTRYPRMPNGEHDTINCIHTIDLYSPINFCDQNIVYFCM